MQKIFSGLVGLCVAVIVGAIGYAVWYEIHDPGHGTITGKHHRDAYVTCTTANKHTTCTNHPECYQVKYTDGRHDGDACVTALEYDRYQVGQQYPAK